MASGASVSGGFSRSAPFGAPPIRPCALRKGVSTEINAQPSVTTMFYSGVEAGARCGGVRLSCAAVSAPCLGNGRGPGPFRPPYGPLGRGLDFSGDLCHVPPGLIPVFLAEPARGHAGPEYPRHSERKAVSFPITADNLQFSIQTLRRRRLFAAAGPAVRKATNIR